ncbi:MAG: thioredoxin [Firmicutes bacterium]|nr:thioredoxin [Bacillota bacterium]
MREILDEKSFNDATSSGAVMVDFWAPWCGQCKAMMPMIEQIEKENPNATFIKVNADELEVLSSRYDIQSLPTLVFLKNGAEVTRLSGMKPKSAIVNELNKII